MRADASALRAALGTAVVRRALVMAAVVGSVLGAINHGDAILAGTLRPADAVRIAVTYLVPYTVSTVSSVLAIRDARLRPRGPATYGQGRSVRDMG